LQKGATMAQIKSFGVLQTATVVAACYAIVSGLMSIPVALVTFASGGQQGSALIGIFMLLAVPVLLAVGTFVGVAVMCFFYNLVASFVGGIEIEIE
jgi:hypothetical protein